MGKPYSVDLRLRVVSTYKKGKKTQKEIAEIFGISICSVKRYIKLDRGKKSLKAMPWGGGRPGAIDKKGYELIEREIKKRPTLTLKELSERYYKQRKKKLASSILSRACQKLKLTKSKTNIFIKQS